MSEPEHGRIDAIDLRELVRFLVSKSGKSASRISGEIGRGHGFVSSLMHQRSIPTAALLADIAQQCGYALTLSSPSECITIFPRTAWENPGAWGDAAAEIERSGRRHICAVGEFGSLGELGTYPEVAQNPEELARLLRMVLSASKDETSAPDASTS